MACVCSKASTSGGPSDAARDIHNIAGADYECATHNHLTKQNAQRTELTICVFPNDDAIWGDNVLGDKLDKFAMDIISEAGISEVYDLNQADSIVQIDEGGKSMSLTITRPIADFQPLDDEFGGIAQICASMPLVRPKKHENPAHINPAACCKG